MFENIFIQPAAGDSGTSFGSTLLLAHNILGRDINFKQDHTFLGPSYSEAEIENEFKDSKLSYKKKLSRNI